MTNYWPLLKHLQEESSRLKRMYKDSFLALYFGEHMPIAEPLWNCPDHERQLTIAVRCGASLYLLRTNTDWSWIRFLMTRLWLAFMVPLNKGEHETLSSSVVINTQKVIEDEMWAVTVWRKGPITLKIHETVYYVLESTCEVVGRPAEERLPVDFNIKGPSHRDNTSSRALAMRVDWTSYVENRLMPPGFHDMAPPTLLSHLRWTNAEEYELGISKHWLSRIENEGELGAYKLKIAQRYILACVVNNRQVHTPATCTIKIADTDILSA